METPSIYLKKFFPIEGREDFYKWVIQTPNGLAKDFEGKVMYFDSFNLDQAERVMEANRRVAKMNSGHLLQKWDEETEQWNIVN